MAQHWRQEKLVVMVSSADASEYTGRIARNG
jgi:hypothetical protein